MSDRIDLIQFCLAGDSSRQRFNMSIPFVRYGWEYATDGKIAVRIPSLELDSACGEKKFPPVHQVFDRRIIREVQWPERRYCPQCFDRGSVGCDGCDECRGCGARKCLLCNGDIPSLQVIPAGDSLGIEVGDHLINVVYDELIRTLPNVRYCGATEDFKFPLPFIFDGGEGTVMGLNRAGLTTNSETQEQS